MKVYNIKIQGTIEIEEPIDIEQEYSIALKRIGCKDGEKTTRIDKMDREVIVWKMINLDTAVLISEGKAIMGKPKKGSISQTLRFRIFDLYDNQYSGGDMDKEEFYTKKMGEIIDNINEKII